MVEPINEARLPALADWAEAHGGCVEAVASARALSNISVDEWLEIVRSAPESAFPAAWAIWGYLNLGDFSFTREQLTVFLERIARDPIRAAHAYLDFENLTEAQELILLKGFHSAHREDGKAILPTIEEELRNGTITRVERKPR